MSELFHYGTPRHSGRYPWGSGKDPFQRNNNFYSTYTQLRKTGMSTSEIAKAMGYKKTSELKARVSMAKSEMTMYKIQEARRLKEHGYSNVEIGKRMSNYNDGKPIIESTIRSWLEEDAGKRMSKSTKIADALEEQLKTKKYLDVGKGVETVYDTSQNSLNNALAILQERGYTVYNIPVNQLTTGHKTNIKVLAPPGEEWGNVVNNSNKISSVIDYTIPGAENLTKLGLDYQPKSISSKRIGVRWDEDGGSDKDGVIELRRGVDDISLGNSHYAQVRIAVDGTHYIKGMALYSDNLPDGVDILVNSNKSKVEKGGDVLKALKPMKRVGKLEDGSDDPDSPVDWDNPFGATIKKGGQSFTEDGNLRVINKVNEEGDWSSWKKTISSQVLSKQSKALVDQQLDLSYLKKVDEYEEIMSLTNPTVRKNLLKSFADDCDASAVDLKAAAFPRQASHVILPINSLKDDEVYAPNYKNGETVYLIRYPHAGQFEIPTLKVNNGNKEGSEVIGKNAKDAIGINSKVASILSGADFDGDSVLVIPRTEKSNLQTQKPLKELEDFNPSKSYKGYKGMKVLDEPTKQLEMGKVSNLISDMTLKGAPPEEVARAVKHSMVVIDAVKHELDWKRSEEENRIPELKEKYQGGKNAGASTIISRAKSVYYVPERKQFNINQDVDHKTGEVIYRTTDRKYVDKSGKLVTAKQESTKMAETKDARTLMSDSIAPNPKEVSYANYANKCKALANKARKEYLDTKEEKRNPSAAETYSKEVESLKYKLQRAESNAPKERQALILANATYKEKLESNPSIKDDKDAKKKIKQQAMAAARTRVGAKKSDVIVEFTEKEWEAVNNHAVSPSLLNRLLNNADMDRVKELASPKDRNTIPQSRINAIKAYANTGHTNQEIADILGISTSTVSKYL